MLWLTLGVHTEVSDGWDADATVLWLRIVAILTAFLLSCCLLNLPHMCPKLGRRIPIPYSIQVWAKLSTTGFSYYYDHAHAADGQPPERVIFFLPGLKMQSVPTPCISCSAKTGIIMGDCCGVDTIDLVSLDDGCTLYFRGQYNKDLWYESFLEALYSRNIGPSHPRNSIAASIIPPMQPEGAFRAGSFARPAQGCTASWFVDGADLFGAAAAAITDAQQEVMITDWMLSPEVLLGRDTTRARRLHPESADAQNALSSLLVQAAERGVRIYIMIFKELTISVPTNSAHAADGILKHRNIQVLRHPNGITLWSHHEKLLIIDQVIAFIGGIDLAFGRFDTRDHPIADQESKLFPGKDFYNPRIQGFSELEEPHTTFSTIDRECHPRMPWHDVAICVSGSAARDAAQHFCQRWTNHIKDVTIEVTDDYDDDSNSRRDYAKDVADSAKDSCCFFGRTLTICCCIKCTRGKIQCGGELALEHERVLLLKTLSDQIPTLRFPTPETRQHVVSAQLLRSACDWSVGHNENGDSWYENSIQQAYIREILDAERLVYIENQFFISSTANHSGDADGDGELSCSERCVMWKKHHISTEVIDNQIVHALATRIERAIHDGETFRVVVMLPNYPEGALTETSVQVVLHYELLTLIGIDGVFASTDGRDHSHVHHFGSLVNRVQEACALKFGEDGKDRWTEYLMVGCLRSYDMINAKPVIEQIYIHAKLLIVDDRTVICGSANINDRSMLGTRDSEVCVCIKGQDATKNMAGIPFQVSSFAHSLRKSLWAEHLGIAEDHPALEDAVCDQTYNGLWRDTARNNSNICAKNFPEMPSDRHKTLAQFNKCRTYADVRLLKDFNGSTGLDDSQTKEATCFTRLENELQASTHPDLPELHKLEAAMRSFKGHLFMFPLNFLEEDVRAGKLKPEALDAENAIPIATFL